MSKVWDPISKYSVCVHWNWFSLYGFRLLHNKSQQLLINISPLATDHGLTVYLHYINKAYQTETLNNSTLAQLKSILYPMDLFLRISPTHFCLQTAYVRLNSPYCQRVKCSARQPNVNFMAEIANELPFRTPLIQQVLRALTSSLVEDGHFFFRRLRLTKFPVWSLRVLAWLNNNFASVLMFWGSMCSPLRRNVTATVVGL